MTATNETNMTTRCNTAGRKWLTGLSIANMRAITEDAEARHADLIDLDLNALAGQLRGAILHVSGGRVAQIGRVAYFPAGSGYMVAVELDASDTYTVRRISVRGGKITAHGERSGIYADDIAEAVIRAGSFRSYSKGEW